MAQRIRIAEGPDIQAVLNVWLASEAHATPTDRPDEVTRLMRQQPGGILVAEVEDRVVGTIICAWDGWRGNIYRLAVVPHHRRQGIARQLVQEAGQRFRRMGARRASLLVISADRQARDFWNSLHDLGIESDPLPKTRYVWNL